MPARQINPAIGLESFSCPTCGALAHQYWFKPYCDQYANDDKPYIPAPEIVKRIETSREYESAEVKVDLIKFFEARLRKAPFFDWQEKSVYLNRRLENCEISQCYSCDALAIWIYDRLIFPAASYTIEPNVDLGDEIKLDFLEAAKIIDISPRGAAALLRLCVQKICIQLGESGRNIDADIGSLVRKGLEPAIQQALDIVRVVGNEAVHPGQIDLRDDRDTATKLFQLINIIADAMISRPKQIAALYATLPPTKLDAIEKRDAMKEKSDQKPPASQGS